MSYCALFKVNEGKEILRGICFSKFYTNTKSFNDIYIYALDDYNTFKSSSELGFNAEEIKEYLNSFLEMGFNFTYSYLNKIETDIADTGGWELHMSSKENSAMSMMIMTNVFRYLYEKQYKCIVQYYLKLKNDDRKDVSNWNKFMMCHYSQEYWRVHTIGHSEWDVVKMLTEDEFKAAIINQEGKAGSTDNLPKAGKNIQKEFKNIIKDFEHNISNVYSYFDFPKMEVKSVIPKTINNKYESISSRIPKLPRVSKLVAKPRIGANCRRG